MYYEAYKTFQFNCSDGFSSTIHSMIIYNTLCREKFYNLTYVYRKCYLRWQVILHSPVAVNPRNLRA